MDNPLLHRFLDLGIVKDKAEKKREGVKLTKEQAESIRSDTRSHDMIAWWHGISRSHVSMLKSGHYWDKW